jgi:NAD(P)-dependent dehydrogenase (short-subunit alcohol dehydrogenase family)
MNTTDAIPSDAKVAIVTGASRGIGAATARAFARAGAAVVIAARDEDALASVAEHISAAGGRALVVPTDVGDAASVERLVARTVDAYGRLDIASTTLQAAATFPSLWRRWRWRTTTAPSRSAFAASSCR